MAKPACMRKTQAPCSFDSFWGELVGWLVGWLVMGGRRYDDEFMSCQKERSCRTPAPDKPSRAGQSFKSIRSIYILVSVGTPS